MSKTAKGIVTVLVVAAIVGGVFVLMNRSKSGMAKYIAKMTGATYFVLLNYDAPYLKAWATALRKNEKTFTYNDKQMDTETGRAIV